MLDIFVDTYLYEPCTLTINSPYYAELDDMNNMLHTIVHIHQPPNSKFHSHIKEFDNTKIIMI